MSIHNDGVYTVDPRCGGQPCCMNCRHGRLEVTAPRASGSSTLGQLCVACMHPYPPDNRRTRCAATAEFSAAAYPLEVYYKHCFCRVAPVFNACSNALACPHYGPPMCLVDDR
jgi:hypothetical protein